MQLPEILTKSSSVIEILNTCGLILLGAGFVIMYRALVSKSKLVTEGLKEIKDAYDSVLTMMKKRSEDIDARFEDEKRFRTLYLSLVEDSEAHKAKIRDWSRDELTVVQKKLSNLQERLTECEEQCQKVSLENEKLKVTLAELKATVKHLESQNAALSDIPSRMAALK
jgi:DNA repair exonuclease SbcCD ATPase subunit